MQHNQHPSSTREVHRRRRIVRRPDGALQKSIAYDPAALALIDRLCRQLQAENITYCHWKSNNMIHRSASGENDLDLLIRRSDGTRFEALLHRLGFKPARAAAEKHMPGVLDYFGYDEESGRLIHVHAHYQLVLGHDMSKNYRLPIERQYLDSAVQGSLFRIPAAEFEFIVFVLRMVLKHSTWDTILGREGRLKKAEREELAYLQVRVDPQRVHQILQRHLPYIGIQLFDECLAALQPQEAVWRRMNTGHRLQKALRASGRRPISADFFLKLWRRLKIAFRRRVSKSVPKYRLERGGAMIAIVGGDGAGKSTAVEAIGGWLSEHFDTSTVHFGKPAWSLTTTLLRGILKIGNFLGLYPEESSFRETLTQETLVSQGYPWLLREICRARDRFWTYIRARRKALHGELVICDRYTVPQIRLMDGPLAASFLPQLRDGPQGKRFLTPQPESWFAGALVSLEESYYRHTVQPEVLAVLRVSPEIAVQRKTDEDAAAVRERSTEIWEIDWSQTNAHVIDASQSRSGVLTELKALIWSHL